MSMYFTSDLHIGHALIANLRSANGMCRADDHDYYLADCWDSVVRTGDHVWVLGDLSVSDREVQRALDWIDDRPGIKHFIAGNHDQCFPGHRDSHKYVRKYMDYFASVQSVARKRIAGQNVLLSHFPYPGTSEGTDESGRPFDDRYAQYRLPNLGLPIIHGHTHRNEQVSFNRSAPGSSGFRNVKQIHVGVDAWGGYPVSLSQVEDLL